MSKEIEKSIHRCCVHITCWNWTENSTPPLLAYLGIMEVFKVTGLLVSGQAGGKIVRIVIVGRKKMKHVSCKSNETPT